MTTAAMAADAFQFTRPRGARPDASTFLLRLHVVSIHAPTGGATLSATHPNEKLVVSIHAPTGGATSLAFATAFSAAFQFTRPRGARPPSRQR